MFGSLLAAAVLAGTAHAATVDPGDLVLRPKDVPAGYVLERNESGTQSNEQVAREFPEFRKLSAAWGRVTGYQRIFERGERTIEARVDLFRNASGARRMLAWSERQAHLAGVRGLRQRRADVGAGGWIFWVAGDRPETYVYWRHGRAWSVVGGHGVSTAQALGLARRQQRLVAAGL